MVGCYRKLFQEKEKNSIIRETHLRNLRKAMGNVGEQHTVKGWNKNKVERAREIERERDSAHPNFGGKTPTFYWDNLGFQSDVIVEYVGCARRNRRSAMAVQLTTENTEVAPCLSLEPRPRPLWAYWYSLGRILNHKPLSAFICLINLFSKSLKIFFDIPRSDICVVKLSAFLITDVKCFHKLRLFHRKLMVAPLACFEIAIIFSTNIDGEKT